MKEDGIASGPHLEFTRNLFMALRTLDGVKKTLESSVSVLLSMCGKVPLSEEKYCEKIPRKTSALVCDSQTNEPSLEVIGPIADRLVNLRLQ